MGRFPVVYPEPTPPESTVTDEIYPLIEYTPVSCILIILLSCSVPPILLDPTLNIISPSSPGELLLFIVVVFVFIFTEFMFDSTVYEI